MSDSRFWELMAEFRCGTIVLDDVGRSIDPTHPVQRIKLLEDRVGLLTWVAAQTLKELAKRDGVDTTNLPEPKP